MSAFMPNVFYKDPMAAMDWLKAAFGFETAMLLTDSQGRLAHAEMSYGDGVIAVGPEWSSAELLGPASAKSPASLGGVCTQFLRVLVERDIDGHCERARAAGARITQAPQDQFYGARTYRALDLDGHVWTFFQHLQEVPISEMERASGLKFATEPSS